LGTVPILCILWGGTRMDSRIMQKATMVIVFLSGLCLGQGCSDTSAVAAQDVNRGPSDRVDEILNRLNRRTGEIKTYQCAIEHLSRQPLFDSQTLRTGRMWYLRDKSKSLLRVDFDTLKQDDQPQEKYVEQFFFDGVWLTRVDHQLKEVKKHQLIDPNELDANRSVDAFELISEHLPIVGFTGTDKLRKEFDITLAEPNSSEPNDRVRLRMTVKPDSVYKDDWVWIDFWIDTKNYLPAKVVTLSTQEDIYEISLLNAMVNEPIDAKIFDPVIPQGFVEAEVVPLKGNR